MNEDDRHDLHQTLYQEIQSALSFIRTIDSPLSQVYKAVLGTQDFETVLQNIHPLTTRLRCLQSELLTYLPESPEEQISEFYWAHFPNHCLIHLGIDNAEVIKQRGICSNTDFEILGFSIKRMTTIAHLRHRIESNEDAWKNFLNPETLPDTPEFEAVLKPLLNEELELPPLIAIIREELQDNPEINDIRDLLLYLKENEFLTRLKRYLSQDFTNIFSKEFPSLTSLQEAGRLRNPYELTNSE